MKITRSPLAEAYFRFLQLAKALQADASAVALDANERALLEAVALCWFEDRPMTVREAIALESLGSPATLHKRITRLRQKDMLVAYNQEGDRRAKYLVPSEKTLQLFADLGAHMGRANHPMTA
jgi:DNA-binding MarR family transcriptional regulator